MAAQMLDTNDGTPLFCAVCETVMSGMRDAEYHRLHRCCEECGMQWAERRRSDWCSGWRPDKDEIQAALEDRRRRIFIEIDRLRGL